MAPAPGRLYILTHPMEFRNGVADDVGRPTPRPFVIDASTGKLRPLEETVPLSGEGVRVMRYNPLGGYLLLGYEDGGIDLIYDDGSKREVTALSLNSTPGARTLHEATFSTDGERAYIATDFGYMRIGKTKSLDILVNMGVGLTAVAEIGDDLIAIMADGSLKTAPRGSSSIADFGSLMLDSQSDSRLKGSDGAMITPLNILPLSDDAFCCLVYLQSGNPLLSLVVRRGAAWHALVLQQDGFKLTPSSTALNSMGDNNGLANRDGYYFHTNNIAYQVIRNADFSLPDDQLREEVLKIRYKVADRVYESASWDFERFWFYKEREGFYPRQAESGFKDDTKWMETGSLIESEYPIAYISDEITWHPTRGLMLQNHGTSRWFPSMRTQIPSKLCALKDGKWSNFSPSWHTPTFTADNSSLASLYNTRIQEYPVNHPKGVEVDPDNPDYVYSGSQQGGVVRFNLSDLTAPILHMSHPKDRCADFPGYVRNADTQTSWSVLCNFTPPKFDNEGNLWSLYYDLDRQRAGESVAVVRVWPKEDRLASDNANINPASFREWKTLVYPDFECGNYGFLLPLKNTANSNLIVLTGNEYAAPMVIIDHNGTLTDTSDDRRVDIGDLFDADGAWVTKDRLYVIKEDPASGMVWVGSDAGIYYFSPAASFNQPGLVMRPTPFDSATGVATTLLDGIQVMDISFDSEGRKWIATLGDGIVCLSADNSRIEGHWTTRNSIIPSDKVYAVGCDLADGNVLISTERGLAEFVPYGNLRRLPGMSVSMTPSRVEPGYAGWISVKGLPSAKVFSIADASGKIVKEISSPGDGTLRWDGTDIDGQRCPTGRYHIVDAEGRPVDRAEIIML